MLKKNSQQINEKEEVTKKAIYLKGDHLGGALDQNNPSQQEQEGVGNQGVHRFPIQK